MYALCIPYLFFACVCRIVLFVICDFDVMVASLLLPFACVQRVSYGWVYLVDVRVDCVRCIYVECVVFFSTYGYKSETSKLPMFCVCAASTLLAYRMINRCMIHVECVSTTQLSLVSCASVQYAFFRPMRSTLYFTNSINVKRESLFNNSINEKSLFQPITKTNRKQVFVA